MGELESQSIDGLTCIKCTELVLPGGKTKKNYTGVYILIEGGQITEITDAETDTVKSATIHYQADIVTSGFIDIHHHGLGGADDVAKFWKNPAYTQKKLVEQGVTSFLASVVFSDNVENEDNTEVLAQLEQIHGQILEGKAVCEGIHAEGPVVTDLGGLPPCEIPSLSQFRVLLDQMPSCKVMTISPHYEANNNYERINLLLERGIVPALGHDRQSKEDEILGALKLQPSQQLHITHIFNVCDFHHRNPGLANFGLIDQFPNLPRYMDGNGQALKPPTIEVIGDLCHVHPLTISGVLSTRHFSQVAFVSDCVSEAVPGKEITYAGRKMRVSDDGICLQNKKTGTITGSCSSSMNAFKSLVEVFRVNLAEAVAMVSENPARIAKLDRGLIQIGKRADILMFDKDLNLQKTMINGKVVWELLS